MTQFRKVADWAKGANNLSSKDRLPDGFIRHGVNVDPLPGGRMALRSGFEAAYQGTAPRGVLALGDNLLIADGEDLVEFNTETGTARVLRSIAGAGVFAGDVLNERVYFCTTNECLEYDGTTVRPWGVPTFTNQPSVTAAGAGGLVAGYYQIALTLSDAWGREGGTDKPLVIYAEQNAALVIGVPAPPAGYTANVYVSAVNGSELYLQNVLSAATTIEVGIVRDDVQRCNTVLLREPSPGNQVVAHNSVLAIASGPVIQVTRPMQPHLVDRVRGFLQYPTDVNAMVSAGALFVSADKCYSLTNVETDGISQKVVLEYPAVSGTAVLLPDGRGAWMTRYGQAITNGTDVELVNRGAFAPELADSGTAGVLDSNGNQLIVTTLKGPGGANSLAAADFFIGEIVDQ